MAKQDEKALSHGRDSPLGWLGHRIVKHPWHALGLWIAIVLICLLPASEVGSVISSSFSNPLPSTDQSVVAQNEFAKEFPGHQGSPSSAIILVEGSNIAGPVGKNLTLQLSQSLALDRKLHNVSSIDSLYSTYGAYLGGEVALAWRFLAPSLTSSPSLPSTINQTSGLLWGTVAVYVGNWNFAVAGLPSGAPPASADWPAYRATQSQLAANPLGLAVLSDFYNGTGQAAPGFNASIHGGCLSAMNVSSCAGDALLANVAPVLPSLFPTSAAVAPAALVLSHLDLSNWSNAWAQQPIVVDLVGGQVGVAPSWLLTAWRAFPGVTPPSTAQVSSWVALQVQADPLGRLPLPIPGQMFKAFVNPSGTATFLSVSFNVDDTYTANGSIVTYADVDEIKSVATQHFQGTGFTPYVTGSAPLDQATNDLATSTLSLLLVLTVVVLLVIMLLYFRSPSAPLLAFGMIGIALVASLAGIFAVGKLVTTFNSEIESIILVFLMSIGTDYSVFLLARYREELVRGKDPEEAVYLMVRWAGQSISTSGLAVIVVAIALTLSNISFLEQLGLCLLIAVAFALVVNLTVLPAIVRLVGPKIFWPNSGTRFKRYAERRERSIRTHKDYIARAGRSATRSPKTVIALILLLSIPVVVVALQVPVSYDITNIGLPASNPAQAGFVQFTNDFGEGATSPSFVLVTFTAPVLTGGVPDNQTVLEVAGLVSVMNGTPGVAAVSTFVGSGGAPASALMNYSVEPVAVRIGLEATVGQYVSQDGKTVLFNVQTTASGYSASAIDVLNAVRSNVQTYASGHPGIAKVYYGGAAPTTEDIRTLVNTATEEMLIGAAVGLMVLMFVMLESIFVPLLAMGVIGLSILWSWAGTYFVVGFLENEALIFLLPLILLIMIMGLGMDYNVLLLTRVKEERILGNRGSRAIRSAVTHAGGVIVAAAVILGGAFLLLGLTSPLGLLAAIGLGIGFAVLLQAFVVQLYFTPAVLTLGKDWIWKGWSREPNSKKTAPRPKPEEKKAP